MPVDPASLSAALQGRYRLDRELGTGGMATVYLAEDLKHHRQVAIKVLRPELAALLGAERFLKEIETTAGLQHPHILPLFDSGQAGALLYYVMPFVPGESLRQRLTRDGELPVADAVRIARAVASALGAAHRRGIVHRDIKPENILLADGEPVVADFGIAKAISASAGDRLTSTGLAVGTPAYMSPEQAAADSRIDGRTDLYSLGAVLYEMLAGEQPFRGRTAEAITARKLTEDAPALHPARSAVPEALDLAVQKALARNAADRYQTAEELVAALDMVALADSGSTRRVPAVPSSSWHRWAPWALAAGLAVVAGLQGLRASGGSGKATDPRLSVTLPSGTELYGMTTAFALTPDGLTLVYTAGRNDSTRLYARRLDDFTARPLAGTEGGDSPFMSPDGRWVGFFARQGRQLKKVLLSGGAPLLIADGLEAGAGSGQWGPNDTIYFSNWPDIQLRKVGATGGEIGTVTHGPPPDGWFRSPVAVLPDGRHALVEVVGLMGGHLDVVSLETGEHQTLLRDVADARLLDDGTLVYVPLRHTDVLAVPFDLTAMKVTGQPVSVLDSVAVFPGDIATAYLSVSRNGTLAYVPTGELTPSASRPSIVLVGRDGTQEDGRLPVGAGPRFSPDGSRLMYHRLDRRRRVAEYVYDLARGTEVRLTPVEQGGGYDGWPVYSPDGRQVVFNSDQGGGTYLVLYARPADGSGQPVRLATDTVMHQQPFTFTAGGRELLYTEGPGANGMDIWSVPWGGAGAARPLMDGPSNETQPALTRDGQWLAWVTDATGRLEVMVRRYPDGSDVAVSREGGVEPVWSPDGRELYFRDLAGTKVMAATFHPGSPPMVDEPRVLFTGRYGRCYAWCRNYDVSPDGRRFAMVRAWDRFTPTGYWPLGTEVRIVPQWNREVRRVVDAAGR